MDKTQDANETIFYRVYWEKFFFFNFAAMKKVF